jgi:murein L,D-transpeptidase YcbB/YkuD
MTGRIIAPVVRLLRGSCAAGALWLVAAGGAAAEERLSLPLTAYKQAVAERIGADEQVAAFYRARDFAPLWTGDGDAFEARRAALLEALGMATDHGLPAARHDADALMARMATARSGRDRGTVEMALTEAYLRFARDLQSGVLEPGQVDSDIKRKAPRREAGVLLAALAEGDPRAAMRDLIPPSAEYARLVREKLLLERVIARDGWAPVVPSGRLEPGEDGAAVVALRDRLIAMGYLDPHLGASYDARLTEAVRGFQIDHGLEPDGIAGAATLREINTPPEARLKSVIVAMERERWLNLPEGRGARHVLVNLTDFHAQIIDDDKTTFRTRSVIGHQDRDRQTPEFSDVMDHMVINPTWYIPRSIIVGEYLPLLRNNPGAVGHLQIVDSRGRVVSRGQSFARFSARTFPYSMKQPPGPRNALGSVKFMFPNKYNIYLHDTPSQHLFKRDVRTFSHGCVRLDDPHEFAYNLLAPQQDDPVGHFQRILRTGAETRVDLETPLPVHLIYRTAFTQAKGKVNYRRDVYDRDRRIWRALADAGVGLRAGRG